MILIVSLILFIVIISYLINSSVVFVFKRNMKRISSFNKLTNNFVKYSNEISDEKIKNEYLSLITDVINTKPNEMTNEKAIEFSKRILEYKDHIPTLRQLIREQKINQLL